MKNYRILYLSVSHYNTPKEPTIERRIHINPVHASTPVSLRYEVKEHKFKNYKPILVEVYKIDLNELKIEKMSEDNMIQPTETQIDTIKGMCNILGKSYNDPKTKNEASAWINYNMEKKKKKCDDALDKNKTPPTEKQISYIKGICEVLEIEYKEPKTKGEAIVWLNHFVPFYKRKCEENEIEWEANNSELVSDWGDRL